MHPQNPAILTAGTNHNNFYFSTDSGKTWKHELVISKYGVWGDPVTHISSSGAYYFFHLANPPKGNWIDRIVVQKKTDLTQDWVLDTFVGLNGAKAQDKHWVAEDLTQGNMYLTWTQFDEYGSEEEDMYSNIMFSMSKNEGASWSTPKKLNSFPGNCLDNDSTVEGAVPAVGKNGEIYTAWAGPKGLLFDRSLDFGKSWEEEDIFISDIPGGWVFDIPGIYRCNGLPVTKTDLSEGKFSGSIYVHWADQRNGKDNTDLFLSYSRDGGSTWSNPTIVNHGRTEGHQFQSWLDVDPATGYLYVVYYDRSDHYDNYTDVCLAISKDGGNSFTSYKISERPFLPKSKVFFGDYSNIVVKNGIIRPVWTRLDSEKLSAYTALINSENDLPSENTFRLSLGQSISSRWVTEKGELLQKEMENIFFEAGVHQLPIEINEVKVESEAVYYELWSQNTLIYRQKLTP